MKLTIALPILLLLLPACASSRVGRDAVYVNDTDSISGSEWLAFADQLANEILASPAVARRRAEATLDAPLVLGIGDFSTKGARMSHNKFQKDRLMMYNRLRSTLVNQSGGTIAVNMDITGDKADASEKDSLINNVREGARGSVEYDQSTTPGYGQMLAPTIGINGQVVAVETYSDTSRDRRTDYQVAIKILDLKRGVTIGEFTVDLPKSFEPGFFGG